MLTRRCLPRRMNLLLLPTTPATTRWTLAGDTTEARHVRDVLRRQVGGGLDIGCLQGPYGKATVQAIGPDGRVELALHWLDHPTPPPLAPLHWLIGLPRPQTARDLLREAATLGVGSLHFFQAQRGEPGYAQSTLWTTSEWHDRLCQGAAQAFATAVPTVAHYDSLATALATLAPALTGPAIAHCLLDNYEASGPLPHLLSPTASAQWLALGPERGWHADERALWRRHGWPLAHLGPRVLRAETAFVAATTLALASRW